MSSLRFISIVFIFASTFTLAEAGCITSSLPSTGGGSGGGGSGSGSGGGGQGQPSVASGSFGGTYSGTISGAQVEVLALGAAGWTVQLGGSSQPDAGAGDGVITGQSLPSSFLVSLSLPGTPASGAYSESTANECATVSLSVGDIATQAQTKTGSFQTVGTSANCAGTAAGSYTLTLTSAVPTSSGAVTYVVHGSLSATMPAVPSMTGSGTLQLTF